MFNRFDIKHLRENFREKLRILNLNYNPIQYLLWDCFRERDQNNNCIYTFVFKIDFFLLFDIYW